MAEPDFTAFATRYAEGRASLVVERLIGDLETPVAAFLKLSAGRRGRCFLLESIEGGAVRGRYSMIGLDPDVLFRASGGRAEIARDAHADPPAFTPCPAPPLAPRPALIAASILSLTLLAASTAWATDRTLVPTSSNLLPVPTGTRLSPPSTRSLRLGGGSATATGTMSALRPQPRLHPDGPLPAAVDGQPGGRTAQLAQRQQRHAGRTAQGRRLPRLHGGQMELGTGDLLRENRGFEHCWRFLDGNSHSENQWDLSRYTLVTQNNEIPAVNYTAANPSYQTNAVGDYSLEFIDHDAAKNDGEPFFTYYMALGAPHFPIGAPGILADNHVSTYAQGWDVRRQTRYNRMMANGIIDSRYPLPPLGSTAPEVDTGEPVEPSCLCGWGAASARCQQPLRGWRGTTKDGKSME